MDELEARRRVNVRGIIYKDGKIFAQQLHGANGEYWCLPGGGTDSHESVHDAITRELIEETGVTPDVGHLAFVQQFSMDEIAHGADEQLEFFFIINNPDDFEAIDLETTSHGVAEVEHCDFIDPKQERILPEFLSEIDLEPYVRGKKPVYFYSEL